LKRRKYGCDSPPGFQKEKTRQALAPNALIRSKSVGGGKKELVIATRNKKKKAEIISLLEGLDFTLYDLDDFDNVPEVEENRDTFKGNAVKKALEVSTRIKKLTLADDSGLEVDALDGRPGIYSARFAGPGQDDQANMDKLLGLLKGVPVEKRTARFRCVVALTGPEGVIGVVEGKCEGLIAFEKRGMQGFGYDPIFIVPEYDKTFAELGSLVKDKISHRAKALEEIGKVILNLAKKYQ